MYQHTLSFRSITLENTTIFSERSCSALLEYKAAQPHEITEIWCFCQCSPMTRQDSPIIVTAPNVTTQRGVARTYWQGGISHLCSPKRTRTIQKGNTHLVYTQLPFSFSLPY